MQKKVVGRVLALAVPSRGNAAGDGRDHLSVTDDLHRGADRTAGVRRSGVVCE